MGQSILSSEWLTALSTRVTRSSAWNPSVLDAMALGAGKGEIGERGIHVHVHVHVDTHVFEFVCACLCKLTYVSMCNVHVHVHACICMYQILNTVTSGLHHQKVGVSCCTE